MAGRREPDGEVLERTRTERKVERPPQFRVILHNDDYTTMEFVVQVLQAVFLKPVDEAFRLMLTVHTEGSALCGVYPHEVAETKVGQVHELAREAGFPLRASLEEE